MASRSAQHPGNGAGVRPAASLDTFAARHGPNGMAQTARGKAANATAWDTDPGPRTPRDSQVPKCSFIWVAWFWWGPANPQASTSRRIGSPSSHWGPRGDYLAPMGPAGLTTMRSGARRLVLCPTLSLGQQTRAGHPGSASSKQQPAQQSDRGSASVPGAKRPSPGQCTGRGRGADDKKSWRLCAGGACVPRVPPELPAPMTWRWRRRRLRTVR